MRVGFITSVLWPRYGHFWNKLAADANAELAVAEPENVLRQLEQRFVREIPSTVFRLATAEAIALADCDWIVTPQPNRGNESRRGGAQDPWISDFPEVLSSAAGLRNLFAVPVRLDSEVEPLAVTFLQELLHDGWQTRKIMERHRHLFTTPRPLPAPGPTRQGTVGVIGQPWLTDGRLATLAVPGEQKILTQGDIDPAVLREEGARHHDGLPDTDLEVLGAVHWLSRRGGIERIVMLVDGESQMDTWLAGQAARATRREFSVVTVQDVLAGAELHTHLLTRHASLQR